MKLTLVFSVKIKRLAADFLGPKKLLFLPEPRVFRQLAWNSLKATTNVGPIIIIDNSEVISEIRDELLMRDINYDSSDK